MIAYPSGTGSDDVVSLRLVRTRVLRRPPAVTSPVSPRILPWIMPVDLKGTGFRPPPSGSVGTGSRICVVLLIFFDGVDAVGVVVDNKQTTASRGRINTASPANKQCRIIRSLRVCKMMP